jgi:hypothetical protein
MVEEFQRRLRLLKEGVGGKLLSPHTINGKLRRLKHALNMAVERRYIRRNPMGKCFRFEPVEEVDPVQVPDEWKQAVLDACPTLRWKAFLYLLVTTGCRRSSSCLAFRIDIVQPPGSTHSEKQGVRPDRTYVKKVQEALNTRHLKAIAFGKPVNRCGGNEHQRQGRQELRVHGGGQTGGRPGVFHAALDATCTEQENQRLFHPRLAGLGRGLNMTGRGGSFGNARLAWK